MEKKKRVGIKCENEIEGFIETIKYKQILLNFNVNKIRMVFT